MSGPILLGKKNTLLDWSKYNERCLEKLGYIPDRTKRLSGEELIKIGFIEAGKARIAFRKLN